MALTDYAAEVFGFEPAKAEEVQPPDKKRLESIEVEPLELLYQRLEQVELIETMTEKIGDTLTKYRDNESGEVIPSKVPLKYYIAAAVYEIVEAARKIGLGLAYRHGAIYAYTGTHWQEVPKDTMMRYLSKMALKVGFLSKMEARTPKFREDIFKQFAGDALEAAPEPPEGGPTLINLQNGTLEIDSGGVHLREHRPKDFLTYCLPYDYNPEERAPLFQAFLERVLPEQESRMILQEFMGYAFTRGLKLEKALVLYGSGANGKSVVFEVATAIFGKENISHKGLGELCKRGGEGDNRRAEVENKILNYSSELNPHGADVDIFKTIVSQEQVGARRLYNDSFTYRPTVKLIFNANKLPGETEKTEAYFRRFIILPFEVTIPESERDPELSNKIIRAELPGVLNWIIAGLQRVTANHSFTKSPKADNALEAYKKESNSVAMFVEEYSITPTFSNFLPSGELYRTYSEFCNESGYRRLSKSNFGKEMKALGFESERKRVDKTLTRGYWVEIGA